MEEVGEEYRLVPSSHIKKKSDDDKREINGLVMRRKIAKGRRKKNKTQQQENPNPGSKTWLA